MFRNPFHAGRGSHYEFAVKNPDPRLGGVAPVNPHVSGWHVRERESQEGKSFREAGLPIGGLGVAQVGSGLERPGPALADWGVLRAGVANFGPRTERRTSRIGLSTVPYTATAVSAW